MLRWSAVVVERTILHPDLTDDELLMVGRWKHARRTLVDLIWALLPVVVLATVGLVVMPQKLILVGFVAVLMACWLLILWQRVYIPLWFVNRLYYLWRAASLMENESWEVYMSCKRLITEGIHPDAQHDAHVWLFEEMCKVAYTERHMREQWAVNPQNSAAFQPLLTQRNEMLSSISEGVSQRIRNNPA